VAVRFLERGESSRLSHLGDAVHRAARFRAGWVGRWTFPALAALVGVLWVAGLAVMWRVRRVGLAALATGAVVFLNAGAWAIVSPALMGPDEEAHVAYAEHLATGHVPDSAPDRQFASSDERRALGSLHHYSVIFATLDTRPPWEAGAARAYARAGPLPRDDGGGRTGASENAPIAYAAPALAARVSGGSFFDRLLAMRLACALLAGLAAACVCLTLRELVPAHPWAGPAGGLAVGFQPMFGFIGGAVNPEASAAAAGALLLYLVVRALRRGLSPGLGAAIAATLVVGALAKLTVLTLAPAVAVALVVLMRRRAAPARALAAFAGTAATLAAGWAFAAVLLDHEGFPGVSRQALAPTATASEPVNVLDRLSYLWQVFLPPVGPMEDLYKGSDGLPAGYSFYVKTAWGSFGWLTVDLPSRVLAAVAVALMAVAALAAVVAWRDRAALRGRRAELAVLALGFASLAVATHLNFAPSQPGPYVLEQGRYLFPVATVAAVGGIGACFAFGRRWAPVMATALVAGMMVFSGLCQLLVFTAYYT
jgi:hypothetical protein